MSFNLKNQTTLTGHISTDIYFKEVGDKKIPYAFFVIAVKQNYKTNGAYETDFIPIVAWRQQATFLQDNAMKGQLVTLQCSVTTKSMNVGQKRKTEIGLKLENFSLLEHKQAVIIRQTNKNMQVYPEDAFPPEDVMSQFDQAYGVEGMDQSGFPNGGFA
ncbi:MULTISPECIES: single-stranded DNA-binding protein [Listeria]|uniref:Single-strand binding protein(Helix-destabilizing protein) n=1 Tax=Listeria riparia FSL S10-1204 TaxID=1265816 RepID=W7CTD3_9LIST|nr:MULTISPECIES: single-stranded DNA-binding protein [Listeria]EUJ42914.1 single-strand binding protein(helix-destabilizing protein) [Listeria riparia FSL S10-1204]MBC2164659.1 single-stranded DNA-binding protein [Listeria booriae]